MQHDFNKSYLLTNREIIDILIGDKQLTILNPDDIKPLHLSTNKIKDISKRFGLILDNYSKSRWELFQDLLKHCINKNKLSDLFDYLFKENFSYTDNDSKLGVIIIETAIKDINAILSHSGTELVKCSNYFYVKEIDNSIEMNIPNIKIIDLDYIKTISQQINKNIDDGDYESAITKSRTLLEEVFMYILDHENVEVNKDGDIHKLYKKVRNTLNLQTGKNITLQMNTLLSGLNKIVEAISKIRNDYSDAHGAGARRLKLKDYEVRLCANSALSMADYLLSYYNDYKKVNSSI